MNSPLSLETYISSGLYKVNGYLKKLDAEIIGRLGTRQAQDGIVGSLAEIGVHHGKLFFILALLRQAGEKVLAMDLFEDDDGNLGTQHQGRDRAFYKNKQKLDIQINENEVLKCDSLKLSVEDITRRIEPIRIFSIDGGHLYHHVENDLKLASLTLAENGIVIIDDFCTAEWPEVTFAAYDFLRDSNSPLCPFLITKNKLYLCRHSALKYYSKLAGEELNIKGVSLSRISFAGRQISFATHSKLRSSIDDVRSRVSW